MGQYYLIVNLDKKEYLRPSSFGDGAKLLDFGDSSGGTMTGLAILLASGNGRGAGDLRSNNLIIGSWAGDRIVIAGEYADANLFGVKTRKKPITVQIGKKKNQTQTCIPESQNIYSLIVLDEYLEKKVNGGKKRKWKNISKTVIQVMKEDEILKENIIEHMK